MTSLSSSVLIWSKAALLIPPAGIPPAGIPPAGIPPAGIPPAGIPPEGIPPDGIPPDGIPPDGMDETAAPTDKGVPASPAAAGAAHAAGSP